MTCLTAFLFWSAISRLDASLVVEGRWLWVHSAAGVEVWTLSRRGLCRGRGADL